LIVEDNSFQRDILEKLLDKLGFQVDISVNGHRAILSYKAHAKKGEFYDIILMDIYMPEMDGFEATKEIRLIEKKNPQFPRSFICGMSSEENKSLISKCIKFDLNLFLPKPISLNSLKDFLFHFYK